MGFGTLGIKEDLMLYDEIEVKGIDTTDGESVEVAVMGVGGASPPIRVQSTGSPSNEALLPPCSVIVIPAQHTADARGYEDCARPSDGARLENKTKVHDTVKLIVKKNKIDYLGRKATVLSRSDVNCNVKVEIQEGPNMGEKKWFEPHQVEADVTAPALLPPSVPAGCHRHSVASGEAAEEKKAKQARLADDVFGKAIKLFD